MPPRPPKSGKQGCLLAILRLFGLRGFKQARNEALPYRRRDDFLSRAEIAFFRALLQAAPEGSIVLAKVRIADLLFVVDQQRNFAAFNHISAKHVDYVVVDSSSMQPYVVIELDDASHRRADREARDEFVDAAFEAAGLPLLRFAVTRGYEVGLLRSRIEEILSSRFSNAPSPTSAPPPFVKARVQPYCPKCDVPMVQRTATRGMNAGQPFWGCVNYPRCRATAAVS